MSLFDNFDIKDLAKIIQNPDPNRGDDESSPGSSDEDEDQEKVKTKTVTNSTRLLGPSDIDNKKEGSKDKDQEKSSASEITENEPALSSSSRGKGSRAVGTTAKEKERENSSSIWSQHELGSAGGDDIDNSGPDVSLDPRRVPAYEMYFSQTVTPEDAYLQMGYKTPATASCENLIVKIALPGEEYSSMKLELKEQRVELRSPQYILSLATPHPLDPRAGNAKWHNDTETLVLTLKLRRDMDMFNF